MDPRQKCSGTHARSVVGGLVDPRQKWRGWARGPTPEVAWVGVAPPPLTGPFGKWAVRRFRLSGASARARRRLSLACARATAMGEAELCARSVRRIRSRRSRRCRSWSNTVASLGGSAVCSRGSQFVAECLQFVAECSQCIALCEAYFPGFLAISASRGSPVARVCGADASGASLRVARISWIPADSCVPRPRKKKGEIFSDLSRHAWRATCVWLQRHLRLDPSLPTPE